MNIIHLSPVDGDEPTSADLAAIEAEQPLMEAERDLLDGEIALITAGRNASALDIRRVRRAERRVLEVTRELANRRPDSEVVA
jgi:hypothetical protein